MAEPVLQGKLEQDRISEPQLLGQEQPVHKTICIIGIVDRHSSIALSNKLSSALGTWGDLYLQNNSCPCGVTKAKTWKIGVSSQHFLKE